MSFRGFHRLFDYSCNDYVLVDVIVAGFFQSPPQLKKTCQ